MKTVTSIAILLTIAIVLASAGFIYSQAMEVIFIDEEADEVYIETFTGFVYVFTGVEDYMVGDIVSVIMFSDGTPSIVDDIVIQVRFTGWVSDDFC